MTIDNKDILNSILQNIYSLSYIKPEDLPNIDLYMDQVTTFMEGQLASTKRYPEDKVLTKTMINNYAKNSLLPSPEKKKYSRDHLLVLIFIYYFKNILSINDIQTLFQPITDKYFKGSDGKDMAYIYNEVFGMEKSHIEQMEKNLLRDFSVSSKTFQDADPQDQEFLRKFSFICELSFDVYIKKMIIEKLIDQMAPCDSKKEHKKSSKKTDG